MYCLVTHHNFHKVLHTIKKKLPGADFVAINGHFSGNPLKSNLRHNSFVPPEELYLTIRKNISNFTLIWFELTLFYYCISTNEYKSYTYIFYIFQRNVIPMSEQIRFQQSSLEPLRKLNFDFNKLFKDGITYLNAADEHQLEADLTKYAAQPPKHRSKISFPYINRNMQQAMDVMCLKVYMWLKTKTDSETLVLSDLDNSNILLVYLAVNEINYRFTKVWASYNFIDQITVKRVVTYDRALMETTEEKEKLLEKYFLNVIVGFSNLFKVLTDFKKPIIGHDLLLLLAVMYKQFYKPLPDAYEEFKIAVHNLFPAVYDVKLISHELQPISRQESLWDSNELDQLFQYFVKKKHPTFNLHQCPTVQEIYKSVAGDAGTCIDYGGPAKSYQAGCCFLNMMHILTACKETKIYKGPFSTQTQVFAIETYVNCLYTSLANISYMDLSLDDPSDDHYKWLLVKPVARENGLDCLSLEKECSDSITTAIRMKRISQYLALISTTDTENQFQRLFQCLKSSKKYDVSIYKTIPSESDWKLRAAVWSLTLTSSIIGWFLYKTFKRKFPLM